MNLSKKTKETYRIDNDNCGYGWDEFKQLVPINFMEWLIGDYSTRLAETARFTGKSYEMTLWFFFCFLNFEDWNGLVGRKDKQTHFQTTIPLFLKVANRLRKDFDIDIGPENPFGIKWDISPSTSFPMITYKERMIRFISVGKFSDADLGMEFPVGGIGDIWVDEVSKPAKEDVPSSDAEEIFQNAEQIVGSAIRGDFEAPKESIKEWFVDVHDSNENGGWIEDKLGKEFVIHIDGVETTKKFKTKRVYFYKKTRKTFTLNPWDPANYFHDRFYEDMWEKDYLVQKLLHEQNCVIKSFKNEELILMRGTSWMAKDGGYLSSKTENYLMSLKRQNYQYYLTVVNGEVLESDNLNKYVYREDMKFVNIVDLQQHPSIGKLKIVPEYITIGVDWGWSKIKAKKSVIEITGYFGKDFQNNDWNYMIFLDEWHAVSKSTAVDDEQWKIEQAADFIFKNWDFYQNKFMNKIYIYFDEADKTAANSVRQEIIRKYGVQVPFLLGAKHDSQNGWGINNRTQFGKELLSSNRVFIDPAKTPVIYKELMGMLKSKDSQKRNPLSANDGTTAWEYGMTKTRFFMKRSKIKPLAINYG